MAQLAPLRKRLWWEWAGSVSNAMAELEHRTNIIRIDRKPLPQTSIGPQSDQDIPPRSEIRNHSIDCCRVWNSAKVE
jgi:hypothetical protein